MESLIQILNTPPAIDWRARAAAIAKHARVTADTLTKKHAKEIAGGDVTAVSKMPCKTYSLPTRACNVGMKLAEIKGSVCYHCYANKGCSVQYKKTVDASRESHLAALANPLWTAAMVKLIGSDAYFRWHTAGDVQSLEHLACIVAIAIAMPKTKFWLPTREYRLLQQYKDAGGVFPRNLIIRTSASMLDGIAPTSITGNASSVHTTNRPRKGYTECIARYQDNACGDCRKCWNPRVAVISYHLH